MILLGDNLSIFGIVLEIIGFILLWSKISKKVENYLDRMTLNEYYFPKYKIIPMFIQHRETWGVVIIIVGLILQIFGIISPET